MIYNNIALVGSPKSPKSLVANLLSEKLKIRCVSINLPFEFHLKDDLESKHIKIRKMIISLAYFHEWIRNEQMSSFISDGSVLYEYILSEANNVIINNQKTIKNKKLADIDQEFEDRFLKIATEYMNKTYDRIYFLQSDNSSNESDRILDEVFYKIFINLIEKTKIQYTYLKGNVEMLVNQIAREIV